MKKLYVLILFIFIVNILFAQPTFEKIIGSNGNTSAIGAVQTFDGGYAIAGYIYANKVTGIDLFIVKMDANGNIVWNKTYGGHNDDYTYGGFEQTADSGFILLGDETDSNEYYNKIIKTNSNGDTLWTKVFTPNYNALFFISNVHEVKDGGYILTEDAYSMQQLGADSTIFIKIDSLGNIQWIKNYYTSLGGLVDLYINKTADGNYILSGFLNNANQPGAYGHFIKMDANGDTLMTRSFGHLFYDSQFTSAYQTKERGIISAGFTEDSNRATITEAYIVKTNSTGLTNCNSYYNIIESKSELIEEQNYPIFSTSLSLNSSSWLLVVSSSGTETDLCNFNGISEINREEELSIYPNPTDKSINLSVPSSTIISSIQIFDVTGRCVISQSFSDKSLNEYPIDMSKQPQGYYIVRINSSVGIINKKLVLQ